MICRQSIHILYGNYADANFIFIMQSICVLFCVLWCCTVGVHFEGCNWVFYSFIAGYICEAVAPVHIYRDYYAMTMNGNLIIGNSEYIHCQPISNIEFFIFERLLLADNLKISQKIRSGKNDFIDLSPIVCLTTEKRSSAILNKKSLLAVRN